MTISGENFFEPINVTFGGTEATDVVVVDSTTLTCVTPAGTGIVYVAVTTSAGTHTRVRGFCYAPADKAPQVFAIDPCEGPDAGGTDVTITGENFAVCGDPDDLIVEIGGTEALNLVLVSDTEIRCTTPPHEVGCWPVTVTTSAGTGTLEDGFCYPPACWPSTIMGVVTDSVTGDPIIGATITVAPGAGTGRSSSTGQYVISNLDGGMGYSVEAFALGYVQGAEDIFLFCGVVVEVHFQLVPSVADILGDLNNDGQADALDVQLVINEALSVLTGYDCDLDGDGLVNALDVQIVINAALGVEIQGGIVYMLGEAVHG